MANSGESEDLPFEEQSNIIIKPSSAKNNEKSKSLKQDSDEGKTEKKDKKTEKKKKSEADIAIKKLESEVRTENLDEFDNSQDDIPLCEIIRQSQFKEFLKEAEKKSEDLKLKIVSQLSEVFKIFDIDRDGIISENDLRFTFTSLGETISEEKIKKMINESSKPIDFETFVSLFEDKEMEFDSQFDLIKAFSKWDNKCNGLIREERNDLQTWGDKFSERDADRALEEAPVCEENGEPAIDYVEFCTNLCGLQNIRKNELFHEKYLRDS